MGALAMPGEPRKQPGLYLHIPFCASICPYCDFAVLKGNRDRRQLFVEALISEIDLYRDFPATFETIYFGGGTPSLLTPGQLEGILSAIFECLAIAEDPWISLEANPEDVDEESLSAWRRLGVRTLSLGVQSFDANDLSFLGRSHSPATAKLSVEKALDAGLQSVSLDLIYGLAEQSLESWRRQLDTAIALGPQHVSCYQLTVHERTVFGVQRRRGQFRELSDDLQEEFFFETHRRLAAAGYDGYEVSNFAVSPAHRSRHNCKYWDHSPYVGLGPSAHSFSGRERWWNEDKEGPWRRKISAGVRPVSGRESLSTRDLVLERLLLGFRTAAGVDLEELERVFGVDLEESNGAAISKMVQRGWLERQGQSLVPSLSGLAIADSLALAFEIR